METGSYLVDLVLSRILSLTFVIVSLGLLLLTFQSTSPLCLMSRSYSIFLLLPPPSITTISIAPFVAGTY